MRTILLFLGISLNLAVQAQDLHADLARINAQGFQNSQVMATLTELSDLYGPRLTGTRQYLRAAQWAKKTMESWGVDKVVLEPYCDDCMGWDLHSFNVELTEPNYLKIEAYPYAWTESSQGEQNAELVWIEDFTKLDEIKEKWQGKLQGKAVLMGKVPKQNMLFESLSTRLTEEELKKAEGSILPAEEKPLGPSAGKVTLLEMERMFAKFMSLEDDFFSFLKQEGALGVFGTTALYPGILHPSGTYKLRESDEKPIPYFAISPEDFGILHRIAGRGISTKIRFHLNSSLYLEPGNNVNVIGEIQGTDPKLKDEVVMIGAHFDSWHASSGVTDNGTGSAVMMEVMRILKATGLKPRRTIRIGLWGGEEQGYLGSLAYARNHFGALDAEKFSRESQRVSAYLNMDNGAGMMKGVYLQGNEAVRPIFKDLLRPYEHLDVHHLTIQNTNFTDHDVFDHYNIPGFQIIQDRLNYHTVTHHTNLDVLENVPERDLMVNATVLASLVYQIAMRDAPMPRKK